MTDETPPQNPWENTRPSGKKKSDLDNLLDIARQYQKTGGAGGNGSSGGRNNNPPPFHFSSLGAPKFSVQIIILIALCLWLATGLYQVRPDQQGVVMRFGKKVGLTAAGLNYHLPYPFENVIIANTTRENRISVGFDPRDENKDIAAESQMLTGDDNIVDVHFVVTWQVADIGKFLFHVRAPEELTKMAAESVMREIIGQSKIQDILTTGRQDIEMRAQTDLQKLMDAYDAGILIRTVSLRDAAPPAQVLNAFHEVQRAQADAEQAKNNALAYQNDILPKARGEAMRMVQEAQGYKESAVAKASGEAQRFDAIYSAYQNAKEVTQKRMYLEAMEEVYSRARRIIIDKNAGANTIVPLMLPQAAATNLLSPNAPAVTPMPVTVPNLGGN